METPMGLVIFQLNSRMDIKTRINIMNNIAIEQTMPSADTVMGSWKTTVYKNHGTGNLKMQEKKMLVCPSFILNMYHISPNGNQTEVCW